MKNNRLLFLATFLLPCAWLVLEACSDTGSEPEDAGVDSQADAKVDAKRDSTSDTGSVDAGKDSTSADTSSPDTSSGDTGAADVKADTAIADAGADAAFDAAACPKLRTRDAGIGVFCPFSGTPSPGGFNGPTSCAPTQYCNLAPVPLGGNPSAVCAASGTDVDGGVSWQCNSNQDCPGATCCGIGDFSVTDPSCPTSPRPAGFKGSRCRATCNVGTELPICDQTAQCGVGKTCIPFARFGSELGVCK